MAQKTSGCAWIALACVLGAVGLMFLGSMVSSGERKQEEARAAAQASAERERKAALTPAQRKAEEEAKAAAAFNSAKQALNQIEGRLEANAEKLKQYYATSDQVKQATADLAKLAVVKAQYGNSETRDDKQLAALADKLITRVSQQQRVLYASATEEVFIKNGMDIRVTASGSSKDQLRLKYVLMSKPLVYKFQNEMRLSEMARAFGFKKVIYSDGFDESWTVDL